MLFLHKTCDYISLHQAQAPTELPLGYKPLKEAV